MEDREGAAAREALRRRLYAPGASDEDLRRFAALAPLAPEPPTEQPVAPPRRRPRAGIAGLATVAVALAAAGGAVATSAPDDSRQPVAATRTTPTRPTTPTTMAPLDGSVQVVRADLVVPALAPPTPTRIRTTLGGVRTELQRFRGVGRTVIAIDTTAAQRVDGTMLAMLTSPSGAKLTWWATRPAGGTAGPAFAEIVARSHADDDPRDGTAYSMHFYDGAPPTRLVVDDVGDDPWTLRIAFLPREDLPY